MQEFVGDLIYALWQTVEMQPAITSLFALMNALDEGYVIVPIEQQTPMELERKHGARFEGLFSTREGAEAEKEVLEARAKSAP